MADFIRRFKRQVTSHVHRKSIAPRIIGQGPIPPLLFDCAADSAQVLTEGVTGLLLSLNEVFLKLQLIGQTFAGRDLLGLPAFGLGNFLGTRKNLIQLIVPNENAAIVIRKHEIVARDLQWTKMSDPKRVRRLWVQPLRSAQAGAVAENRESDLPELAGIAMRSPNDNASQPAGPRFQDRQITNASFIGASAIIDHQDISRMSGLHGFEEDIHAAEVLGRQSPSRQTFARNNWQQAKRRDPDWYPLTQRGIEDLRCA